MEETVGTSLDFEDPSPPRVRLGSKQAIRRTLGRIIADSLAGKRSPNDLGRYVNALQVLFSMQVELDKEVNPEEELSPYSEEQAAVDDEKLRARGWIPSSGPRSGVA